MIVEYCFAVIGYLILFAAFACMVIGFIGAGICFVVIIVLLSKEPLAYLRKEIRNRTKRKDQHGTDVSSN